MKDKYIKLGDILDLTHQYVNISLRILPSYEKLTYTTKNNMPIKYRNYAVKNIMLSNECGFIFFIERIYK